VYADNSSLPPSMPHTAGTTIAEGDYEKLVSLLGAAFDGTAQRGSKLPILYGEFGVETVIPSAKAGAYSGVEPPSSGAVDEDTQARYYEEALKLALCQPNVIGILVFHVVDERALAAWQSGPFYADGTPKSSFDAIHQAVNAARAGTLASCPDRKAPSVSISGPTPDGTVTGVASDDIGVGQVQLLANDIVVGVKYSAPYTFAWKPSQEGRYTLGAADDRRGGKRGSRIRHRGSRARGAAARHPTRRRAARGRLGRRPPTISSPPRSGSPRGTASSWGPPPSQRPNTASERVARSGSPGGLPPAAGWPWRPASARRSRSIPAPPSPLSNRSQQAPQA